MKACNFVALAFAFAGLTGLAHAKEPDSERQQELRHLLKHDCGSCHGMRLTGGLGPALTPDAIHEKPDVMLRETILHGRRGTPMPPFANLLSHEEVDWLIGDLRKGSGYEQ